MTQGHLTTSLASRLNLVQVDGTTIVKDIVLACAIINFFLIYLHVQINV